MVTQVGYVLGLHFTMERFFIVDLPEVMELDQYLGNLVHCWRATLSSTSSMWMGPEEQAQHLLHMMNDDHGHGGACASHSSADRWLVWDTIFPPPIYI
jgi:hypothetical protein